jgi:hypothetical protein
MRSLFAIAFAAAALVLAQPSPKPSAPQEYDAGYFLTNGTMAFGGQLYTSVSHNAQVMTQFHPEPIEVLYRWSDDKIYVFNYDFCQSLPAPSGGSANWWAWLPASTDRGSFEWNGLTVEEYSFTYQGAEQYTFFRTDYNVPVLLHAEDPGSNFNGNYTFFNFQPRPSSPAVFDVPTVCQGKSGDAPAPTHLDATLNAARMLMAGPVSRQE